MKKLFSIAVVALMSLTVANAQSVKDELTKSQERAEKLQALCKDYKPCKNANIDGYGNSIKEAAEMVGLTESNLRFWEKEIPSLKPKTTGNGIRQYTEKDIENLKAVYNLVKVRGFKIAAAKKMLATNKEGVEKSARVIEGLMKVRDELKELKHQLDYLV